MNPERWREIDRICNSAMDLAPEERPAFVWEACAGDEALFAEVSRLLARQEEAEDFLGVPALVMPPDEIRMDAVPEVLLHYRIEEQLGAGGMGEVYRARDQRLGRDVAVKLLPSTFALDPDLLARLHREARLMASLSHPNIAAIYGLEIAEERHFLVLELVEGETLAQRIARGPLQAEEALEVCRSIAEGVEAAHEKGIFHRDLKPGNVKITPEGKVKVLDFGLAKPTKTDPSAERARHPAPGSGMTLPEIILGTAPYMAPEQVRGKTVDKRGDIWAFGCILYECLTGKRAFEGQTTPDVFSAILNGEPDWGALPAETPLKMRDLLRRCLQKDPNERLHDIADARIEITEALNQPVVPLPAVPSTTVRAWKSIALLLGLVLLGTAAGFISTLLKTPPPGPVTRFRIALPSETMLAAGTEPTGKLWTQNRTELDISSDGKQVVYSAAVDGLVSNTRLYLYAMERGGAEAIPGTEGARMPFFSPDGKWIGFWSQEKLWKIPASGGIPIPLCDRVTPIPKGASWNSDGRITIGARRVLESVDERGGKLEPLTTLDRTKESSHRLPHYLPGGKIIVFTVMPHLLGTRSHIEVVSVETGKRKVLIEEGTDARYVSTGHLVYICNGTLMAVPFDPDRMEKRGAPMPLVDGVMHAINLPFSYDNSGAGQFAVASQSGALVYASGGIAPDATIDLLWVDRGGGGFGRKDQSIHEGTCDQCPDFTGWPETRLYDGRHRCKCMDIRS